MSGTSGAEIRPGIYINQERVGELVGIDTSAPGGGYSVTSRITKNQDRFPSNPCAELDVSGKVTTSYLLDGTAGKFLTHDSALGLHWTSRGTQGEAETRILSELLEPLGAKCLQLRSGADREGNAWCAGFAIINSENRYLGGVVATADPHEQVIYLVPQELDEGDEVEDLLRLIPTARTSHFMQGRDGKPRYYIKVSL